MKTPKPLGIFDHITDMLKRLILDHDLEDEEAENLAETVNKVNKVRKQYTDRKLKEIQDTAQYLH